MRRIFDGLDKKHSSGASSYVGMDITYGFDDNGETGSGKRLLSILNETFLVCISLLHGGSHLGSANIYYTITRR